MPTISLPLDAIWTQVANAGPCHLEAAIIAPIRLFYGASPPVIDDNGHFSLHFNGGNTSHLYYEGEDAVWAKAHQMNIDGTYMPALLVANGAGVVGAGGGGMPPVPEQFDNTDTKPYPVGQVVTVAMLLAELGVGATIESLEITAGDGGFIKYTDKNGDSTEDTKWQWSRKGTKKINPNQTWQALLQPMRVYVNGSAS